MKIVFVNDREKLNLRYRKNLIENLRNFCFVESLGLFDSPAGFFKNLLYIAFRKNTLIISSNLKSNLIVLLLIWKKKVVILNGLGRMRGARYFRKILVILLKMQRQENIIFVQNYADFRFLRRIESGSLKVYWMPGSGGVGRKLGSDKNSLSIITRDEKVRTQISSIKEFCTSFSFNEVVFVGIKSKKIINLDRVKYTSVGYVDQDEILSFSQNIFVPDGYGEGIPHTLVDAVMSDACIYMSRVNYIRYGFYKYTRFSELKGSSYWVTFYANEDLKRLVSSEGVAGDFVSKVYRFVVR